MTPTEPKLVDVLTQFIAEYHQGLNQLAGRGTALEQASTQIQEQLLALADSLGNNPMPKIGVSGKYVRSPQSYQDGFTSAVEELRTAIQHYCSVQSVGGGEYE